MKFWIIFSLFLLNVTLVRSQSPSRLNCGDVMRITRCISYLKASSNIFSPPEPICCHAYYSTFLAVKDSHPCLCKLLQKPYLLGKMLNTTKFLSLSSYCFPDRTDFEDPVLSCEGLALLELKYSFRNSTILDWDFPTDYCNWRGVLCDNNSVVSLNLSNMDLGGEISRSVGKLRRLHTLDLRGNQLRGNIPDDIGNCSSIKTIDFSENFLDGDIPSTLTRLPNLSVLNLSHNNLSGLTPLKFKLRDQLSPCTPPVICGLRTVAHAAACGVRALQRLPGCLRVGTLHFSCKVAERRFSFWSCLFYLARRRPFWRSFFCSFVTLLSCELRR